MNIFYPFAVLLLICGVATAQSYPDRPLRLIVPFPPGGSNDVVARVIGAAGPGSFQHMATELFKLRADIDVVIVQYKGGGPALTDTISGQVQMNVGSVVQNLPHVRSGKLKALGIGGSKRIAALPDVPTFAEAGLASAESTNWWGLFAPAGTPQAVLGRLQQEVATILDAAETRKRFELEGAEVLRISPAQFGELVASETAKWSQVVKQAGIKAE